MKSLCNAIKAIALAAIGCLAVAATPAVAQDKYPDRPVRIVVPWPAGTGIDVQMRAFSQAFSEQLGAPVVVDNRPGAGSLVGYESAARAAADGYTLFAGTNAQFIHQYLMPNAKVDMLKSMEPISLLFVMPQVLVVASNSPAKDMQGLVAMIKAQPGKFNYASGGVGSGAHVLSSAIATRNGLNLVHVPLGANAAGDLPAMLARGDVHFTIPIAGAVAPLINIGAVRPLAVTSRARLKQLPSVPTLAEVFGSERYATDSWNGLFVPAGTPAPIVEKLFAVAQQAVNSSQHLASADKLFTTAQASQSPKAFREFLNTELDKWRDIVKDSGAKLE
ncbi:MAG: tripartite tricarboxylate transporter substrate binding protein [Hydrogenophaga sp.]|nr:tripartite tricarboxylate transporter substrate binding protein [Hydrogenophaga sp.]